jgi:hypothetical protein
MYAEQGLFEELNTAHVFLHFQHVLPGEVAGDFCFGFKELCNVCGLIDML